MTLTHKILITFGCALALVVLGRWSTEWGAAAEEVAEPAAEPTEEAAPAVWTCPMHSQIRLPDFGPCPLCGMDLVEMGAGDDHPRRLAMSAAAKELARITTQTVGRKNVTRPVRMVGKVDYDESAVRTISAWVGGRLERLFVDYTGVRVEQGDHLVRLYSPDLLNAQEELLSARSRIDATRGEASTFLPGSNQRAYDSAREKLMLWGLTEEQVAAIEERGASEDHVMLTSTTSGVVIEKLLDQGAYVKTGTPIYRIADLEHLWVRLDAYEQDLAWLRHGQQVVIEVDALPGESFDGQVSYIDPFLHDHSRTAKVRVNVANTDGRLKPGMLVSAVAMARIGADGAVLDRHLAGKWISPMHPEVVKDGPGACDVCGMDLVPAEQLGMVSDVPMNAVRPIVVPASAVLLTGKRAVVYIEVPDQERPTYEGIEVVIGPRAGDEYIVLSGLEGGEQIVVNGAFRIDSSMQIRAKASMMSMSAQAPEVAGPELRLFRTALDPLFDAYIEMQVALAADDNDAARAQLAELAAALSPTSSALPASQRVVWGEEREALQGAINLAKESADIGALRAAFESISSALLIVVNEFGHAGAAELREAFCPMAFDDKGAAWLQTGDTIANPYFGSSMLRCGELRETFVGSAPMGADHSAHGDAAPEDDVESSDAPAEEMEVDRSGHDHAEPVDGGAAGGESDGASQAALPDPLVEVMNAYLALQVTLAADADAHADRMALQSALETAAQAEYAGAQEMLAELKTLATGAGIDAIRTANRAVSTRLLAIVGEQGNPLGAELHVVHCPMVFEDTGADWIQESETIANPYAGAVMLRCGVIRRTLPARDEER
jgi:membrane fusion protein, copper/silver efflux system